MRVKPKIICKDDCVIVSYLIGAIVLVEKWWNFPAYLARSDRRIITKIDPIEGEIFHYIPREVYAESTYDKFRSRISHGVNPRQISLFDI